MARPKLHPAAVREDHISFRVNAAERLQIEQAAAKAGVSSASEYARRQTLEGHVVLIQRRSLEPAVFDELKRIGNNLNQAVRKFHVKEEMPPQLITVCEAFDRLIAEELARDSKNR